MLPKPHGSLVDLGLLGGTPGAIGTQWPQREDVVHEAQQELSLTSIYHTSVLKLTILFFSSEDTSYYK